MDAEKQREAELGAALRARAPDLCELWERAVAVAEAAHAGQYRNDGRPYLAHSLDVAERLLAWEVEPLVVIGGLLHDSVRYGRFAAVRQVAQRLDHDDLASLLEVQTRLARRDSALQYERDNQRFQQIFDLMAEDVRAVLIRCANRLANLRNLEAFVGEQRDGLLRNTEEVYLPLLERLGIWSVRAEVEDLLFQARTPERYAAYKRWRDAQRAARADEVAAWKARVQAALTAHGLPADGVSIFFRRPASIFRRYQADLPLDVDDLRQLDTRHLYATLIELPRVTDLYRALAAVHECGTPAMAMFRDYVAQPKDNGYAALHTTIILNDRTPHRVYLCTPTLHQLASRGILLRAAYEAWQHDVLPPDWQPAEQRALARFLTSLREREHGTIAVLTPQGDVVELEDGATVLDFAYAIHTDLGRQAGRAFVNDVEMPLGTSLHSGDVVRILKDLQREWPEPAWVSEVHTAKARQAIQAQLRQRPAERGRRLLDEALRQHGRKLDDYENRLAAVAFQLDTSLDNLLVKVAHGQYGVHEILERLHGSVTPQQTTFYRVRLAPEEVEHFPLWHAGLLVTVACCTPAPGAPIAGVRTERGVELHRATCPRVQLDPTRRVGLRWESERVEARLVDFSLRAVTRRGLVNDLSNVIRQANVELMYLEGRRDGEMDVVRFTLEITNDQELAGLVDAIRALPNVSRLLVDGREADVGRDDRRAYIAPPELILSPFSPGKPVAGAGRFWGRATEVQDIETLLAGVAAPSLLVRGPRRIGKTSLLQHLRERRAIRERYRYAFVDLQAVAYGDVASLLRHIVRHLARAIDSEKRVPLPARSELAAAPQDAFGDYLHRLTEAYRYTQKRILLALDEVGTLVEAIEAGTLAPHIFHLLRSVIQHNPLVTVLLCTSDEVAGLLQSEGVLELLNVTSDVPLGHLDEEAARQLVQEPLRRWQVYFEPDAIVELLRVTDRHPFYLQILGSALVTHLNNVQRRHVYATDVRALVQRHTRSNGAEFMHLWEQEDSVQHTVLQALCTPPTVSATSPLGAEHVQQRLRDGGHTLAFDAVTDALEQLVRLDTLARVAQPDGSVRYHVRIAMFRAWFAAHYPVHGGAERG